MDDIMPLFLSFIFISLYLWHTNTLTCWSHTVTFSTELVIRPVLVCPAFTIQASPTPSIIWLYNHFLPHPPNTHPLITHSFPHTYHCFVRQVLWIWRRGHGRWSWRWKSISREQALTPAWSKTTAQRQVTKPCVWTYKWKINHLYSCLFMQVSNQPIMWQHYKA